MEQNTNGARGDSLFASMPRHTQYVWLFLIVVICLWGVWYLFAIYLPYQALEEQRYSLITPTREGRYEEAVAQYESVISAGTLTTNRRALAIQDVFQALVKVGEEGTLLQGINEMKVLIERPAISPKNKAELIRLLAEAYNKSGKNPAVYDMVYAAEEPYRSFRAEDSLISTRNLLEWSYSTYPTARAGIGIASSYAKEALYVQGYQKASLADDAWKAEVDRLVRQTERYLQESDALLELELATDELDTDSLPYGGYRYVRALIIPALTVLKNGSYAEDYRKHYDETIAFFENGDSVEAKQALSSLYWTYADFLLLIDADLTHARTQLDKLIAFVKADPQYEINEFVVFIRNLRAKSADDIPPFTRDALERTAAASPEFSVFLEMI